MICSDRLQHVLYREYPACAENHTCEGVAPDFDFLSAQY